MPKDDLLVVSLWALACVGYAFAVWWNRGDQRSLESTFEPLGDDFTKDQDRLAYAKEVATESISKFETLSLRIHATIRNQLLFVVLAIAAITGGSDEFDVLGTKVPQWTALTLASLGLLGSWFQMGWLLTAALRLRYRAATILQNVENDLGVNARSVASQIGALTPSSATPAWFISELGVPQADHRAYPKAMVLMVSMLFGLAHACTTSAALHVVRLCPEPPNNFGIALVVTAVIIGLYGSTHFAFRFLAHIPGFAHTVVLLSALVSAIIFGVVPATA